MANINNAANNPASSSPCAACKLLRRRCAQEECVFAPHFPADQPLKFATVHKVFGASNVNKLLQELPENQRADAVSSLVYEANARIRDPVYGCAGAIACLQQHVTQLQTQLAVAQAQILYLRLQQSQNQQSSPASSSNYGTSNIMNYNYPSDYCSNINPASLPIN